MQKTVKQTVLVILMIVASKYWCLADQALNAAIKAELERNGATVKDRGMVGFVNCFNSDEEVCDNFSNIDVMYAGLLFPCKIGGCNRANNPVLNRFGSYVQLDKNEAVVVLSYMPSKQSTYSYFGIQQMAYERDESVLDLDNYIPPQPGEVIPPPTTPGRYVVDAAMGDSFNQLTLKFDEDPNDATKEIFAIIMTGNKVLANEIVNAMKAAGFPSSAVNVASLTQNFLFNSNNIADSFRLVGRFAFDIGNDPEMDQWISSNPLKLWRVIFDQQSTNFVPFTSWIPPKKNKLTGSREIDHGSNAEDFAAIELEVKSRFGDPDSINQGTARYYDDENCILSGTYCWGNNDDTLYLDALNPDGSLYTFNINEPGTRVVILGLNHVKTEYTTFWNYGFFETSGVSLGSLSHVNYNGFNIGNAFFVEVSLDCKDDQGQQREACFEIKFKNQDSDLFNIMHRNYLNPQTGTGQAPSELHAPLFFIYK